MQSGRFVLAIAIGLLCVPGLVQAQSAGSITGSARDASGAVLPGVTVEVASPALIEKVRVATTDDQGRFNVVDLRPGTYAVTFTLPGFATFRREGIVLTAGFTATSNAEMKVGAIEETVTVTGSSPIVDIQNVRTQAVVGSDVLAALPTGLKTLHAMAAMTLGAKGREYEVGGSSGDGFGGLIIHGSRADDSKTYWDGGNTAFVQGNGGVRVFQFNMMAAQEAVINTGTASAETETSGANVNMIPRDGGNTFKLQGNALYTTKGLASSKVPDALVKRGLAPSVNTMKTVYDYGMGLGGPIKRDRLWFYEANRYWGSESYATNNWFNKSTVWYRYEPDLSRPAFTAIYTRDTFGRLTWQATPKHKINASLNWQPSGARYLGAATGIASPESNAKYRYGHDTHGMWLAQEGWTYPATDHLLFQVRASALYQAIWYEDAYGAPDPVARHPGLTRDNVRITDQATGRTWGPLGGGVQNAYGIDQPTNNFSQQLSVSYITGGHVFKTGLYMLQANYDQYGDALPTGMNYTFRSGVPLSLTQFASPFRNFPHVRSEAVFAQDQWTINRLTLNLGARFDHFLGWTLAVTVPAGPFIGERRFPETRNLPNFKDISPRLGAAYDIFGNGRTAIKGAWGRYVTGLGAGATNQISPANGIANNATRQWNDTNGNFIPDCILTNLQGNGECGTINNLAFGTPVVTTRWDESARLGWGNRGFNYQSSVALQHELGPGLGVTVSYNRTDFRNHTALVNNAVSASDFTPYCVTAPTDTRLGSVSGREICGLFDVNPNKFGQQNSALILAKDVPGNTGRPEETYNGMDFAANWRFGKGGLLAGGVALGRTTFDYCGLNSVPQATQAVFASGGTALLQLQGPSKNAADCRVKSPLWDGSGSQVKVQAVYPLPYAFTASVMYRGLPGTVKTANFVVSNAVVRTSLGRDLSACLGAAVCTQNVTVPLIPSSNNNFNVSGLLFNERISVVDLRITREFPVGKSRLRGVIDLYNAFNNRPALNINTTYGAAYLTPTLIQGGRLVEFGAQFDF